MTLIEGETSVEVLKAEDTKILFTINLTFAAHN